MFDCAIEQKNLLVFTLGRREIKRGLKNTIALPKPKVKTKSTVGRNLTEYNLEEINEKIGEALELATRLKSPRITKNSTISSRWHNERGWPERQIYNASTLRRD